MEPSKSYLRGFLPYGAAAFLVGIVGGFTAVLGPAFVHDLGLAYNNTTWTALALAISSATFAPIMGKLGDVIGRKPTLLLGIGIFTMGNILTATASSLLSMILARFIVGIGTAAVAPAVMSYILTQFPPDAIAKGFSLYMLIASGAVVFGPTLGGWMISVSGWRTMMWVCVALCIPVFLVCAFSREPKAPRQGLTGYDGLGAFFVFLFFGLALCVPSFGQNIGWTTRPFLLVLVAAAAALVCLVLVEWRAKHPILPRGFLSRRTFLCSIAALFLTQGLMQANMTNLIVFVNYTQPENTLISGYAISIMYLGMSLGAVLLGPLADHREPRTVLTGSLLLTAAGCGLMLLFTKDSSALLLAGSLGLLGFGLGGNATIFMKVVLSDVPQEATGTGTGTYGLFRDLSAPFGVAVFVPMFTNAITRHSIASLEGSVALAAVNAIRELAAVELVCVAAGIAVVRMLPRLHQQVAE